MNALDLANSLRADRGRRVDSLDPELRLHRLRDAIRALFEASARSGTPAANDIALLNRLATAPSLGWEAAGPRLAAATAEAEAARTAIELLASGRLRTCGNPRCVQFFLADGRRAFCSTTCANRTRVARHAARHR